MIAACILFVFAGGYGVTTKECRHDSGYYPPSEVVHVVGGELSLPPYMTIVTPPVSYVYRWSRPTYRVSHSYVESRYADRYPIIVTSPTIVFDSRPRTRSRSYTYKTRKRVKRHRNRVRTRQRATRNQNRIKRRNRIKKTNKRPRHRRVSRTRMASR